MYLVVHGYEGLGNTGLEPSLDHGNCVNVMNNSNIRETKRQILIAVLYLNKPVERNNKAPSTLDETY